jgi:methionyl-tRNA formyltransferase
MTPQMDAGDILAQESIDIGPEMIFDELEEKLCGLAKSMTKKILTNLNDYQSVKQSQNHALVTLAPKLLPMDERIDWKKSAKEIHNQIRALSSKPGAWAVVRIGREKKRLKILRTKLFEGEGKEFLKIFFEGDRCLLPCHQGWLEIQELQLEGKKVMSAKQLLQGLRQPLEFIEENSIS